MPKLILLDPSKPKQSLTAVVGKPAPPKPKLLSGIGEGELPATIAGAGPLLHCGLRSHLGSGRVLRGVLVKSTACSGHIVCICMYNTRYYIQMHIMSVCVYIYVDTYLHVYVDTYLHVYTIYVYTYQP